MRLPSQVVAALFAIAALRKRDIPQAAASVPPDASLAVQELHRRLPEAFQRAGLSRSASVRLWGVVLTPDELSGPSAALYQSFLRARDWNVDDSTFMLGEALRWRRAARIESLRPTQLPPVFPADRFSHDDSGRCSVLISLGPAPDKVFDDVQAFVTWRVCMLEQLMHRLDFSRGEPRYTLVLDCRGMRPGHVSRTARRCAKALSAVLCDNYPDYIHRVLVVSPPRLLSLAWGVMGPFLPQAFSNAVQMCDESTAARKSGLLLETHATTSRPIIRKPNSLTVMLSSMFGWIALKMRAALTIASWRLTHLLPEVASIFAPERLALLELAAASTD